MYLLKNHYFQYLIIAVALLAGAYFCSLSVLWMMMFFVLAPLGFGHLLRRFMDDHDFTDDIQDAEWYND